MVARLAARSDGGPGSPRARPEGRAVGQLPDQVVGGGAGDAQLAAVDAAQVVGGAQGGQVPRAVAAALGAADEVVPLGRGAAAARGGAPAPVPIPDPPRQGAPLLQERSPGLEEVPGDEEHALARVERVRGLAHTEHMYSTG